MYLRTNLSLAIAAAALAAFALTTPAQAVAGGKGPTGPTGPTGTTAAPKPKFLAGTELPPHPSSPWYEGEITKGLPDSPFCLEGKLPAKGASYRDFGTEFDTGATQITIVAANTTAARALAVKAEKAVRDCAPEWVRDNPGGVGGWQDHGKVTIEEGAHVYAVHTSAPDSEPGIHLFGVGRDGRTVTIVKWGQMGTFQDAPVTAFKATTKRAVSKLY